MRGITLIGLPAAGKSASGEILAKKLGWKFLDLDKYIAEKQGMSHHQVMETRGPGALKIIAGLKKLPNPPAGGGEFYFLF